MRDWEGEGKVGVGEFGGLADDDEEHVRGEEGLYRGGELYEEFGDEKFEEE